MYGTKMSEVIQIWKFNLIKNKPLEVYDGHNDPLRKEDQGLGV